MNNLYNVVIMQLYWNELLSGICYLKTWLMSWEWQNIHYTLYFQILWLLKRKYLLSKYTLTDKGDVANNISLVLLWVMTSYIYIFLAIFEMFESVSVKIWHALWIFYIFVLYFASISFVKDISFFMNLKSWYLL